MILFLNVFITENAFTTVTAKKYQYRTGTIAAHKAFDRGYLPPYSRLDVFKYSLASLSPLPWTKVIIRYELDEMFKERESELNEYIQELFPSCSLHNKRLGVQSQWQEAMQEVFDHKESNLVLFCCNDDHIFIESNLNTIDEFINKYNDTTEDVSIWFSHWPQMLKISTDFQPVGVDGLFVKHIWQDCASVQLMSKEVLRYWWFGVNYGNTFIGRSDFNHFATRIRPTMFHVPFREMSRHFDGYAQNDFNQNKCPPLEIPPGFFERDIKVTFGKKNGNIPGEEEFYIDASNPNYKVVDPNGAQAKWGLNDIPLFWKDRISDINIHEIPNENDRETAIIDIAKEDFVRQNCEQGINPYLQHIKKAYGFTT